MGRKLNLSHLSEGECRQILDVIQRDFSIRQKEKDRLVKLQKLVRDEEQKRLVLSRQKQFNEKYCICCFSSFGLIFNKRTECKTCGFFICRDCLVRPKGSKVMMCLGCSQQRELQVQVCEWFYGQIRNRFRRFGSAKVVRSLYKRGSQSSDSKESEVEYEFSPSCQDLLSKEASKAFLQTLEKQTSTANTDHLGVPYKLLLENQDWLPLLKPRMLSVAVQAPEDVLSDVLDSRQALEDFVFNLPPEEEELDKSTNSERKTARRHSGPEVVVLDPEGEPLSKGADSSRKVHFGEMPTPAKSKDASLTSSSTGAAYHVLSPIEEVLSSPEMVDKHSDSNGNNGDAGSSSGDSLMDRGSVDRLSLGDDDKRVRADSSSTISPHDWDSGIHMSMCLSQDGGWEVSQSISSGTDSVDGPQARDFAATKPGNLLQNMKSDSVDSFASMSLASLDANDTLDSLETHYNSIHSDMNTPDISDEFVSSSSTVVENRNMNDENEGSMTSMGIEIEQLTLSRSSSEETLKTDDDDDDIDGRVGDLTMEEFLDQLTNLSLSVTSESADENARDLGVVENVEDISPSLTEKTSLSSIEDLKQDEFENLNHRMKIAEESLPLLAEEEDELQLTKRNLMNSPKLDESVHNKWDSAEREREHGRVEAGEKHFRCTKSHHHHSSRSHVHDPATRSKSPYKRSKSNDDFILSGRSGDVRSKSNGSKSHRRDGEPASKCTKESHHHGKHHERMPPNRFIRYDSLPLVVEVFEAEGNYHWHHHSHRDFRQFSRESDSNDSEPSSQVTSKPSRSGAKLVRAPHLSPKSSYEEDLSQSRQLSVESNTTEDTMPKSTSQSSGPTTPESRRDSQMAGMSSEDSSKEEQRSPDNPLRYSPTEQSNSRQQRASHGPSKPNFSGMGYPDPINDESIDDAIDSLKREAQRERSNRRGDDKNAKNEDQYEASSYRPGGSGICQKENLVFTDYSPEGQFSRTMPRHQDSVQLSPGAVPSQSSPLTPPSRLLSKDSLLLLSPFTPPTANSPGASPITTPSRMASLRKDIQELANLTKKVSITQEEMLQSAEEVLTSAHKMSSIQTQVEELEDVLDCLERTVIGESSSLYGSSSENEDSVVGPHEQVVEDMQLLEQQLACSHTDDDIPSETNAATAVRMITTTALKLLSTTEDAMKSHSATMDSVYPMQPSNEDKLGQEVGKALREVALQETDDLVFQGYSRRSSEEEEEMCAGSSTDGSRPSSLSLDDARNGDPQKLETGIEAHQTEESGHHQANHGVSFLHLHQPCNDQDSPLIATLMCETDDDIRNGNGFSAAGSPYQNGDSDMLDDTRYHVLSPGELQSMDSCDLTFDLDDALSQEKQAERRRRKERKLRKSSGYKSTPTREEEMNLLLYNQMAGLEEKVYLSAGKVFTLEERLQQLQERVNQVDRTSPEESIVDLEDKLALTMAQVAQSESQVAAVEAQIAALQQSQQTNMDMLSYSGQFGNVSVAMCDLSSPERCYNPFAYRYGSSVQIQIPRERVDSPVNFVMETTYPQPKDGDHEAGKEVELAMGILKDKVEFNGGQMESFGVERCEVSMELRPIKAVIVRYLQEGDDETLWPDFRFTRNKTHKHAGEKRSKMESGLPDPHYDISNMDVHVNDERHISTLEMSLGYPDDLPAAGLDGHQEVDVSIPISEIEEVTHA